MVNQQSSVDESRRTDDDDDDHIAHMDVHTFARQTRIFGAAAAGAFLLATAYAIYWVISRG